MGWTDFFKGSSKKGIDIPTTPISTTDTNRLTSNVNLLTNISTENKDLSLPFIDSHINRGFSYVRFGEDNLHPNIINNLVLRSPMLSQCINFKVSALIGGGYQWSEYDNLQAREKIKIKEVVSNIHLNEMLDCVARHWSKHGRAIVLLKYENGEYTKAVALDPAKVRNSRGKDWFDNTPTIYTISDDWVYGGTSITAKPYKDGCTEKYQIIEIRNMVDGVDDYGYPDWAASANWANVSGDLALLHKSALQNSVSPSMLYIYPYEFTEPERQSFEYNMKTNSKGVMNHSKAQLVNSRGIDLKPDVMPVQQADNLSIFEHTSNEQKIEIAMANGINPVLMGLQIPGSLGQNEQMLHAANLFKANWLLKNRTIIQNFMNQILDIFDIKQDFILNEVDVIDDKIFIKDGNQADEKNDGVI